MLFISFDPNLRSPLWDTMDNARVQIECGLSKCDILKIADNELEFMTGTTDFDRARRSCGRRFPTFVC